MSIEIVWELHYSKVASWRSCSAPPPILEDLALEDDDGLNEGRRILRSHLGLPERSDLVEALHSAVTSSNLVVRNRRDGMVLATLVGSFSIDDNPMLGAVQN